MVSSTLLPSEYNMYNLESQYGNSGDRIIYHTVLKNALQGQSTALCYVSTYLLSRGLLSLKPKPTFGV